MLGWVGGLYPLFTFDETPTPNFADCISHEESSEARLSIFSLLLGPLYLAVRSSRKGAPPYSVRHLHTAPSHRQQIAARSVFLEDMAGGTDSSAVCCDQSHGAVVGTESNGNNGQYETEGHEQS